MSKGDPKTAEAAPRRCAIYCRVSTAGQKERGYSLATQLAGCREYAATHGFVVAAELPDDCSGTIPVQDRPQGKELYRLVDAGEVGAVILYTHDRTARDELVLEYLLFKSYLFEHGVELHYSDAGLDLYTMEGNLVGYIKAHAAADERKKIRERTMRGKLGKARSGKVVGAGVPPYGYRYAGGQFAVVEEEAGVIRQIFVWYAEGKTPHAIAQELSQMGVRSPGETRKRRRRQSGGVWDKSSVYNILGNEAYTGTWRYGKLDTTGPKRQRREPGETVPVSVPPIVSREVWAAATARRAYNKRMSLRNATPRRYFLRGRIRCACGYAMAGKSNGQGRLYYYCLARGNRKNDPDWTGCATGFVRADRADRALWDWLVNLFDTSTDEGARNIIRKVREMNQRRVDEAAGVQRRLDAVNDQLGKADRQIANLASAVADLKGERSNDAALAALKRELRAASKRQTDLASERDALAGKLATIPQPEPYMEFIRAVWTLLHALKDPTFEKKVDWLARLNVTAVARRDEQGRRWLDVACEVGAAALPMDAQGGDPIESRPSWCYRANGEAPPLVFQASLPLF